MTKGRARRLAVVGGVIVLALLGIDVATRGGLGGEDDAVSSRRPSEAPRHAGTAVCGRCHARELERFRGSFHDRAIDEPSAESVVAPFDGRSFEQFGVTTSFRRNGERYVVRTEGPDGAVHDYRVAYTFGVAPLQQYLLDSGDGTLQALTIAWDSRDAARGGGRFFSLYPDERTAAGDPLHTFGTMQRWNHMCADCHSTAYEKRFDLEQRAFAPTWAELDVGCEACHGPGSLHVAWAEAGGRSGGEGLVVDLSNENEWVFRPGAATVTRQRAPSSVEVDTCAPCHSRRRTLADGRRPDQPFLDFYLPELLEPGLYHADGQIDGEVYELGSFAQSAMHRAGVRCSDCHDPHSLSLRAEGNALCARCHDATRFDRAEHHRHAAGSPGSACVACHMPSKTYMGVDARRDHAIRVPRPGLAAAIGAPDACSGCHAADGGSAWAAERVAEWLGPDRLARHHYGAVLASARRGEPEAVEGLIRLTNDPAMAEIVRATALAAMEAYPSEQTGRALVQASDDDGDLVRLGAVYGARGASSGLALAVLGPRLRDERRAIRIEAARAAAARHAELAESDALALRDALAELRVAERRDADRGEAHLRIALVELDLGRADRAWSALETAISVDPSFAPAYVTLADLARERGDDASAERILRAALARAPGDGDVLHALGLTLGRRGDHAEEALDLLRRAADASPAVPRFAYVYAVALHDAGRPDEAQAVVSAALVRHPHDRELADLTAAWR